MKANEANKLLLEVKKLVAQGNLNALVVMTPLHHSRTTPLHSVMFARRVSVCLAWNSINVQARARALSRRKGSEQP